MKRKGIPAELMNELFGSLPLENAFDLLAKMPNGLLARNVQKIVNSIKQAMKNNKWNEVEFISMLTISEDGTIVKYCGQMYHDWKSIRAFFSIPSVNLRIINKPIIAFFFEMQILCKPFWHESILIGFCDQKFPLQDKWLGWKNTNSFGIYRRGGIEIDGRETKIENDIDDDEIEYFKPGDFVGIGIIHKPNSKIECFATLNDKLLGKMELPQKFADVEFFPAVTLFAFGQSIKANFGKEEWQYKEFKSVLE